MKITMPMTTSNRSAKIGLPCSYRGCIIVPVDSGFDVVDKVSGRWMHVPNQRTAKWNATVWTRLRDDFDSRKPLNEVPQALMAIVPKTKETA